jgi:3-hydroxybutyryl-CoA dehydrogenase
VIAKDAPGFIVNRVARNYYNEAQRIVMEGAASVEQTDRCMKALGFKMGPFELMDLIGVDVNLDVTTSMWGQFFYEPRFTPSVLQQQTVNGGMHGRKTGRGFYPYES